MPTTYAPDLHARPRKVAALGGSGDDIPFEAAFANLAHAYLRDRAPGLLDYEVGFQLVDRDEDDTKAVGVFGFKVGSQWLYAPVYFINGDLKGNELLYIKGEDQFVPLKENWINDLLAKKPASLGEGVARDNRRLGIRHPDLGRSLQGPHKYSSVRWAAGEREAVDAAAGRIMARLVGTASAAKIASFPSWAKVAAVDLARAAAALPDPPRPGLPALIKAGGVPILESLRNHLDAYPTLRAAVDRFYDGRELADALAHVKAATGNCGPTHRRRRRRKPLYKVAHPIEDGRLEIHHHRPGMNTVLLDRADREALCRDGVLIKDARDDDEVSEVFDGDVKVRTEEAKIFNQPHRTGVYDVLTKDGDGETAKCLVLLMPVEPGGKSPYCTVVRLGGGRKAWVNAHISHVWTTFEHPWVEWYEDLPEATSLDAGDVAVIVGPRGGGTAPFEVVGSLGGTAGGGTTYNVRFDCHYDEDSDEAKEEEEQSSAQANNDPEASDKAKPRRSDHLTHARYEQSAHSSGIPYRPHPQTVRDAYDMARDGQRVHLGQKTGTTLRVNRGDVYVPAGHGILKLRAASNDYGEEGGSADAPLLLGNAIDVEAGFLRKTSALVLIASGPTVHVNGRPMDKAAALVHLVRDHAFRAATARAVIDRAVAVGAGLAGKAASFRVKYADGYRGDPYRGGDPYLTGGGPHAPDVDMDYGEGDPYMGGEVPSYGGYEETVPVDDMATDPGDRERYTPETPDPQTMQMAEEAAQTGQRELFDTSMIGSLLRSTRDDSLVEKHLGDLKKALDRCGRMLNLFYWHGDKFAERYGQDDMPELEDSLRNTFEDLGDLVLFLKRRSVEASPQEAASDIDLGDVAD